MRRCLQKALGSQVSCLLSPQLKLPNLGIRKHNARHSRVYRCVEEGCPRSSIGFATINDLYRHEKSVHGKHVGKSRMYKCFAPGCAKASKLWPRLDNFKQHLIRMHPTEDIDALVKR